MKLLILDADAKRARFLERAVAEEGYAADVVASSTDALSALQSRRYDLILLDAEHPGRSLNQLCQEIRSVVHQGPILVITSSDDSLLRTSGFDAGADGFVQRPLDVTELMARVFALLRRSLGTNVLRCGDVELVRRERTVTLAGKALQLRGKEYALMFHLLMRSERVVTREELFSQVWNDNSEPSSNIVDVQMSRLRRKLGDRGWMLETVRGRGYRLTSERHSV